MASAQAAKKLIEDLWHENTINGTIDNEKSSLGESFKNLLKLVSDELYNKKTHFLLELIQNADDNGYRYEVPTLRFTYKKGSLQVDCNEIGFSPANVRAICSVGKSTKAGFGDASHYIGEKGIGFKAVFKVADVVYISSGNFSFKLDKYGMMGMIAPIWSAFPGETIPGHTSFYLQLAGNIEEAEILRGLEELDPSVLIFLRQLREIRISIERGGGCSSSRTLRRHDEENSGGSQNFGTTIYQDSTCWNYVVVKHRVDRLPDDEKRPGCTRSEISIAFPVPGLDSQPSNTTQPVYAFLPIRDYGFKFLLQADFLLPASRQEIIECDWNCALRNASADAFISAVDSFNSGPLKYHWPYYLPRKDISGFFGPLVMRIYDELAKKPVLESYGKTMSVPSSLRHVHEKYLDATRKPFSLSPATLTKYLALRYPPWVIESISSLGAGTLDNKGFIQDLKRTLSHQKAKKAFCGKDRDWHSKLSQVLGEIAMQEDYCELIQDLDIIPLKTGKWVSARGRTIFFGAAIARDIPKSIDINIVHPEAGSDDNREILFTKLGVKRCDAFQICHLIMRMHSTETLSGVETHDLIDQIAFMAKKSFHPPAGVDFWFATARGGPLKRGSRLYIRRESGPNPAEARVMSALEEKFHFIHDDYTKKMQNIKNGSSWLRRACNLSSLPRIHSENTEFPNEFRLSEEFEHLFQSCSSSDVLVLLRDNWHYYSRWVEDVGPDTDDPMLRASRKAVREAIKVIEVDCVRGRSLLQDTVIPTLDRDMDQCDYVAALRIPNAGNPKWVFLSNFGVTIGRNIHYYLRCLKHMQGHDISRKTITYVYQQIQMEYPHYEALVWTAFLGSRLIYTISRSPDRKMQWVTSRECTENRLDVMSEYKGCEALFRSLLISTKGDIAPLVAAVKMVTESTSLQEIFKSFIKISDALPQLNAKEAIEAIRILGQKAIFPIIQGRTDKEYDKLAVLAPNGSPWFVADRHHYRESFLGKIDMLAFAAKDLGRLEGILKTLGLQSRKLSNLVRFKCHPRGPAPLNKQYTSFLKARVPYIAALIPDSAMGRDAVILPLQKLVVGSTERIVRVYTFEYGGRSFSAESDDGEVASSIRGSKLNIFVAASVISESRIPFELAGLIADHCGILNPTQKDLVREALNENNPKQLRAVFLREGFEVPNIVTEDFDEPRGAKESYAALSSDVPINSTPSAGLMTSLDDDVMAKFQHLSSVGNPSEHSNRLDRRLPIKSVRRSDRFLFRNDTSDPTADFRIVLQKLPAHGQYLGELMTSKLFEQHLGATYDPDTHWTSPLRRRAGRCLFPGNKSMHASFTMTDVQTTGKATEFLAQFGFTDAKKWKQQGLTYHFDIVVAADDKTSGFTWNTAQFERNLNHQMRKLRLDDKSRAQPSNVLVLVRISDIYSSPSFDFFVDPWRFFITDKLVFNGEWDLTATIVDGNNGTRAADGSQNIPANSQDSQSRPLVSSRLTSVQERYYDTLTGMVQKAQNHDSFTQVDWRSWFAGPARKTQPPGWSMDPAIVHQYPNMWQQDPMHSLQSFCQGMHLNAGVHQDKRQPLTLVDTELSQTWSGQPSDISRSASQRNHDQSANELTVLQFQNSWTENLSTRHSIQSRNIRNGSTYVSDIHPSTMGTNTGNNAASMMPQPRKPSPIERPSMNPVNVAFPNVLEESGGGSKYLYQELVSDESIRLLVLHPGTGDEPLRGVVFQVALEDAGTFQAISYTWGCTKLTQSLWTPEGTMKITTSLDSALRTLRHHKDALILWVDAICINQHRAEEKKKQVRLLPRVFQHASCVLACLEATEDSIAAMEILMQIQAKEALATSTEAWPEGLAEIDPSWAGERLPPAAHSIWAHIGHLLAQPWFRRAWVIQEVVIAFSVRVICGKWMVDWNDLFNAVEIIVDESKFSPFDHPFDSTDPPWTPFLALARMREMEAQNYRLPLLDLLEYFRYTESSLPQDRFFSLLGLAVDGDEEGFKIDYTVDFEHIARDYAEVFVRQHEGNALELLHRAGISSKPKLPSWIPDWTTRKQGSLRSLRARGSNELQVHGALVDKIKIVSVAANFPDQLRSYLSEVDRMIDSVTEPASRWDPEPLKWSVPIANVAHPKVFATDPARTDMESSYKALRRCFAVGARPGSHVAVLQHEISTNDRAANILWDQSQNYLRALGDCLQGWRFVVTEKGYVGVAPPGVLRGDFVSIVDGGVTPFIMRKCDKEDMVFRLVGECYIHGIMNGEGDSLCGTTGGMVRLC